MNPLTTVIVIVLIFSIVTFFMATTYNTLVLLKNKIADDWKKVKVEIDYRYELSMNYIKLVGNNVNANIINRIKELEGAHKILVDNEQIINNYIDLEKTLFMMFVELEDKKIAYADWNNAYKESKLRLDIARENYNNDVIAMNNKIELFPFSIVGTIGRFNKQLYFRNEN